MNIAIEGKNIQGTFSRFVIVKLIKKRKKKEG